MIPKEQAEELLQQYLLTLKLSRDMAKRCALIAVKEIKKTVSFNAAWLIDYWQDVETEIEKL